jgi:hypothetical protein
MKNDSLSVYNDLEKNRQRLVNKLDSIDPNILSFRPNRDKWSILQVCYHLIRSEELSLIYLCKKIQDSANILTAGLGSSLRSFLLNLSLRLPFPLPAPRRVAEFPENLTWVELKTKWEQIRNGIEQILSELPEGYETKLVYRHPAAGRLTSYQMLTFFRTHIHRHEKQIERLIKEGTTK